MLPVAGAAVDPAPAPGRLRRPHDDRQRLGDQRAEPASAPQHQGQHARRRAGSSAGTSHGGSSARERGPRRRRVSATSATYQTSRSLLAEQPQRQGAVVALEHVLVGDRRPARSAATASSRRTSTEGRPSRSTRRRARPAAAVGAYDEPVEPGSRSQSAACRPPDRESPDLDVELGAEHLGRRPTTTSAPADRACVAQLVAGCSRRARSGLVTTTVGAGVDRLRRAARPGRARRRRRRRGRPAPGPPPGRRPASGCGGRAGRRTSASSRVSDRDHDQHDQHRERR